MGQRTMVMSNSELRYERRGLKQSQTWLSISEFKIFGPSDRPLCTNTMGVGQVNIIRGVKPRVDSNCFTPLRDVHFLTDGNKMKGLHQNKNYWHSCAHGNHWVEVDFPETCVRELKIWSRPDVGHKHTQMTGVTAEVWSDGQWKRCGGVSPSTHGHAASFAFDCALVGTKARPGLSCETDTGEKGPQRRTCANLLKPEEILMMRPDHGYRFNSLNVVKHYSKSFHC